MPILKTVIVDDESLALELLDSILGGIPDVEVVARCKTGREAIAAVMELSPDLMFLDIEPGLSGFDVVKNLQADMAPLVIFATAFEQYALDAFEIHAVDYILKPIDEEHVRRAVSRAMLRIEQGLASGQKSQIINAIDDVSEKMSINDKDDQVRSARKAEINVASSKLVVKGRDEIILLQQADIEWVDAAGDYMCIHAGGETYIKRSTMKELLDDLDPECFKRVHRSTVVNLKYIKKVIPKTKGEFLLDLGGYDTVKVSRNYREVIKRFLSSG